MTMINNSYNDDFRQDCGEDYARGYKDAMVAIDDFLFYATTKDATSIHDQVDVAEAQHRVLQKHVQYRCEWKRRAFRAKLEAMKSVLELMAEADYKQLATKEDTNKENDNG